MNKYLCLTQQEFIFKKYKIIPIRYEDRLDIMNWRNEQIFHLRQTKKLTKKDQDFYFRNIINKLFENEKPEQILFSFLHDDNCIGYGGLVHINWINKNAEISFIMDTRLEKDNFKYYWQIFLLLIEKVAFNELDLKKIYTYAYDIRPHLFEILNHCGFKNEAILRNHVFIDGEYKNVLIHSKFKIL
jgi:RimJ/RimL family protein N-acetyltransferase